MADETNNGTGETTVTPPAQTAGTFTQADVDRMILERLATEKRSGEEKARKAAEKAAADALKDSADFKTLSEKQATALLDRDAELTQHRTQLETTSQERDKYKIALESHVKERRKDVPEHISGLLDVLDPVAQLKWLTDNAEKLGGTQLGGVPATPKPAGNLDAVQREKAQERSKNFYQNVF